jgi:hypothetical protein
MLKPIQPALLLLAASLTAAPAAAADASTDRRPVMEISRPADMKMVAGPAEWFTGRVTITGQFQLPAPSRVGGSHSPLRAVRADGVA